MKCQNCGKTMKLRSGKYGKFWGCSGFPKCRSTQKYFPNQNSSSQNNSDSQLNNLQPVKRALKSIEHPSVYQAELFNAVEDLLKVGQYKNCVNIIVNATAGSGKTASLEHIVGIIKKFDASISVRYLVFNTRVAKEARAKSLPAKTTHSEYFAAYRNWLKGKKINVEKFKVNNIVDDLLHNDYSNEDDYKAKRWLVAPVCSIVSLAKNTVSALDTPSLLELVRKYKIDMNDSEDEIFDLVRRAMKINNKQKLVIDYDDMLWMVYHHNVPVPQYEYVLADEVQDFNRIQIELIKKSVKDDGHVILVGDRNQSMYGFRGAEINSMDILKTAFEAKEMPLSITYRCPLKHVEMVNEKFPNIAFEPFEKAIEGEINTIHYELLNQKVVDGDLVLCRTNAPLISPAFDLIRSGIKAVILGRDIASNLINMINKQDKNDGDLSAMMKNLSEYKQKEYAKLMSYRKESQAESLVDKCETIYHIYLECDTNTVEELIDKINVIFADDLDGVTFSTVHKAKGAEADNVFILTEAPMPHPMATTPDEQQQEQNILFVALTRAKKTLNFVSASDNNSSAPY